MTQRLERRALILHLRDVEGLTFSAIGQRLGISHQAVQQMYQRAKQSKPQPKPPRKPKKYQS
jgi:DNA-directed RNA polymerase specialized sigma24 family protein